MRKISPTTSRIHGVLFDWDGTLLNSYEADAAAYLAMFRALNIPWGVAEWSAHYSPNWHHIYRAAKLPKARWSDADRLWRENYAKHQPRLIPGARAVIERLQKDHALGLVTSGDRDRVLRQLRELKLWRAFTAHVCSGDTKLRKPHPAPMRLALKRMKLLAKDCVYVGDSAQDLQMARSAGALAAIAVLGPYPTEQALRAAKPDLLLESIRELPAALKKLGA